MSEPMKGRLFIDHIIIMFITISVTKRPFLDIIRIVWANDSKMVLVGHLVEPKRKRS